MKKHIKQRAKTGPLALSIAPLALTSVTTIVGLVLSSSVVSATNDSVVDEVSITVPVSCTMTGTGMDSHNAEINNGQYNSNIGTTTLKAFCNDNEGFSIYAVGYTDNEIGKNVLTNSTLGSTHDIITGTAISGNNSNWAMKLATVSNPTPTYPIIIMGSTGDTEKQAGDLDYSAFQNVPSSYVKVAKRESSTDVGTNAEGATLTTTYQAYISPTQVAGTYTGQVKYTMVHPHNGEAPLQPQPSTAGCITYYANASSAQGTMGTKCNLTDGASITLYASNFSRTGYGFAGWSDAYDYATNPNAKFYGPMETITVPEGTTANGLSLYAVWVKSVGTLQDANKVAELCGTTTTDNILTKAPTDGTANLSSVSALTDQRDNQTYAIAKLADGNCWMIENLRLDNQYTVGNNQTNPSVTNASLSQGYNSSFIGLAGPETADFDDSTTANSLYTTETGVQGKNTISGDSTYLGYRFPRYNNNNTSQRAANTTSAGANTYSYGNYYTWAAAIADTRYYAAGNHNTTSICPKGWSIPQGNNTNAGFKKLDIDMGGTGINQYTAEASKRWRKYPTNFLYSGRFTSSSADSRGSDGTYWSSTANSGKNSYYLYLGDTAVYPGSNSGSKYYGYSARCIAGQ